MKIMILLKRKDGMSAEEFRQHYETSHVAMAKRYLGHLFLDYRRNYTLATGEVVGEAPNPAIADSHFDAITEIWLKDRDAWVEMQKIVGDPVIGKIFMDDEENFLDRPALRIFPCEEIVGANE
ncbi:MAG: EthD domain-containing protein [Sphingomonadales bacterium]|jgi:hypothetical protein|nr:EthD domain-containing protein [Sphingomonadales bacterium]MBK6493083.1 EthD domain-containing protein [Sphingomonadales bacterium]MBK6720050.1 EthD domain-containing protein [Sphingomonadales bacterium]MBK8861591.1 EthD domain-containing protein [Sphingomonadales bacterium]MBL0001813.1 EthD domain-containing protein [Sphingomonadales bacterium]